MTLHRISVTTPPGEITVQVFIPTADAIAAGGLAAPQKGEDSRDHHALLPAYVDFHGGGFVIGDLATDAGFCANVAQHVGCVVVNVAYRLAPEYPHPTPVADSFDALKWVARHAEEAFLRVDASRIAVGGFSAGGCIAAALALMARDEPGTFPAPLRLQLLIVPVLDARYVPEEQLDEGGRFPGEEPPPYESYVRLEHAPCLPMHRLVWFYRLWLGATGPGRVSNANDFRASPMVASSLGGKLAPASIHCAEIDPLVSEGRAYHDKLQAAGTPSELTVYPGVGHPFAHWEGEVPAAREFHQRAYAALREAFKL